MHPVSNPLFLQLIAQKIVAVHVELQAERSPGGNPQVTQAEFFIYEIKVIMEAFALVKFQECFSCCFIRGCKEFCVYRSLSFPGKSSICKILLSIL